MELIFFGIAMLILIISFFSKYKFHLVSLVCLIIGIIIYLLNITKKININDYYAINDVYPTMNSYVSIFLVIFIVIFIVKVILDDKN